MLTEITPETHQQIHLHLVCGESKSNDNFLVRCRETLCLITGHQREEISTYTSAAFLEEVADCNEVAPWSSLLQAEQIQQLLSLALKAFHHLGHPPQDTVIV